MASSLALTLAGCNKAADDAGNTSAETLPALPATLPMSAAPAQAPALAPLPAAIPARTIRTVRVSDPRAAYAYADQAGYFSQSLGDGPPDYGFDYEGVRPWAWQGYDGSRVFLEPVNGGYRTYYYRTGADRPYFIRDPQFAYGYDGDQLAAIYGPDGALIPYGDYGSRASYAAAYFWRAQRLFEASRDRQAISAAEWAAHQDAIAASRERWAANRDRQADWAAYHAEEAAQESRYWAEEAARRDADAQRFAAWHQQNFRTPPPPRAIPPRWQAASWAQDGARYAPIAVVAAGAATAVFVAHDKQAEAARRDASRPPAAIVAQQPLMAPPAALPTDLGRRDGRPGTNSRPEEWASRAAGPSPTPAPRANFPRADQSARQQPVDNKPRQPVDQAPDRQNRAVRPKYEYADGRPNMQPSDPRVAVHRGSGAIDRSPLPASNAGERREEVPHMAAPKPAPHSLAQAPHAATASPHAQPAPSHPESAHPGGGRPNGGHPVGGDHGDNHH